MKQGCVEEMKKRTGVDVESIKVERVQGKTKNHKHIKERHRHIRVGRVV